MPTIVRWSIVPPHAGYPQTQAVKALADKAGGCTSEFGRYILPHYNNNMSYLDTYGMSSDHIKLMIVHVYEMLKI